MCGNEEVLRVVFSNDILNAACSTLPTLMVTSETNGQSNFLALMVLVMLMVMAVVRGCKNGTEEIVNKSKRTGTRIRMMMKFGRVVVVAVVMIMVMAMMMTTVLMELGMAEQRW